MTPGETHTVEHEALFRGYSGRMFLAVALGTLVANLGRQAIPPLLPFIISDLAITSAGAGIAMTLMRVAFAVCQYPSGRIADTISRTTAIMLGLVGLIVGFALLLRVDSYPLFVASVVMLGIGSAFFFVAERVLLSDLFVEKRGRAFGVNSAISRIGSILAAGLAVLSLHIGPWQLAFLPVIGLLVGIVLLFQFTSRESYRSRELAQLRDVRGQLHDTVSRVFGTHQVRLLVVAYTLVIFTWEGTMTFLPAYLQVGKNFSTGLASGGFAALFAVGIIIQPLTGTVSDRLDRRLVAGIATLLSGVGLLVILVSQSVGPIVVGILLYAAGIMGFTPVLQAYLMDLFHEANKGGDLGAFKTVYEGVSSVGPTYVGVTAGVASYTVAFSGFLVCLLLSAVILFWLHRGATVN